MNCFPTEYRYRPETTGVDHYWAPPVAPVMTLWKSLRNIFRRGTELLRKDTKRATVMPAVVARTALGPAVMPKTNFF